MHVRLAANKAPATDRRDLRERRAKTNHPRPTQSNSGRDRLARGDALDLPLRHRWYADRACCGRGGHYRDSRRPEGLPGTRSRGGDYDTGWLQKKVFFAKPPREDMATVLQVFVA